MYNGCEAEDQPTTPGVLMKSEGQTFKKSLMTSQTSFVAQQWLYYMQETDLVLNNGFRIQIQHKYFRGEHVIRKATMTQGTWAVDGYFEKNGINYYLEFLGKFIYHLNKSDVKYHSIYNISRM